MCSPIFGTAIPLVVLLISNIIIVTCSSSPSLIETACSEPRLGPKSKQCIQILSSQPKIASADNLYGLSVAIMESGISSATNTRTFIENLSKAGPGPKAALQGCKTSYDAIISSFNIALSEVRDDKEYLTATYDLLVGCTDTFQPCLNDVAAGKVKDPTILQGNDVALIYGFSAYQAIDKIPSEKQD